MIGTRGGNIRLFDTITSLDLTGVSKWYNNSCAVSDLTLSIQGGELIALIGGSGSGKTTTLKMINRLIEPDSGEILINGQNILSFNPIALRRSIGYVIQQIGLFPHMSVAENISIPLTLGKVHPDRIRNRIDELLTLVSLSPDTFRDRKPSELSGGQQQRVGLARALAADPPLLLMDEPFGALDPLLRRQLQEEFLRIKKSLGKTIIFVTHDIDEAFLLGDRIAVLREGSLHALTTPPELLVAAQNDPYLALLTGGDRLCRIRTAPVQVLCVDPGEVYFCTDTQEIPRLQSAIQRKEIRVAIIKPPDGRLYAILPDDEITTGGENKSPLVRLSSETTIQEALFRFSRSSARVAILSEHNEGPVILLEDLIRFLSGAKQA